MKIFTGTLVIFYFLVTSFLNSAIIIDHNCINLADIPDQWIDSAKANLHIGYGHTSHGSQLASGMDALESYYTNGKYNWSHSGGAGELHMFEGDGYGSGYLDHDCGYTSWVAETREYLDNFPTCNVIIWSWCGQVNDVNLTTHYLEPMTQLESDYPNVKFVYMTGHLEGLGPDGSLYHANQQIRDYCNNNNKILFDFADIEKYTPDCDTNFQQYYANDACDYNHPQGGTRNWANNWLGNHPGDVLTQISQYCSSCAHSVSLNCTKKGIACWFLWARLAGWGQAPPTRTITTGSISGSPFCAGNITDIPFTISGTFNIGNKFIAQISNENGSFSNPLNLDTLPGTSSGVLENVVLPKTLTGGTGYRIRVISTDPVVTGTENASNLIINPLPIPSISGNEHVCTNSDETYSANNTSGIQNSWYVEGGSIDGSSSQSTVNIHWLGVGAGKLILEQTYIATGCKSSDTILVTIYQKPEPQISGTNSICENTRALYTCTYIAGHSYKWVAEAGDIIGSDSDTLIIVEWGDAAEGKLQLIETIDVSGCNDTAFYNVSVNAKPMPNIIGAEFVVKDSSNIYKSQINEEITNHWSITGGEIIGSSTKDSVNVKWTDMETGFLTLVQTNEETSCSDSITIQVIITEKQFPYVTGKINTCENGTERYTTTNNSLILKEWFVEGGDLSAGAEQNSVDIVWSEPGTGIVKIIFRIEEKNYVDSLVENILINPTPIVSFAINNSEICFDEEQFELTGGLPLGGDYSGTGIENNIFTPALAGVGEHIITYSYTDENGCSNSAVDTIIVHPLPEKPIIEEENNGLFTLAQAVSYQWYLDLKRLEGANKQYLDWEPKTKGDYTVEITDEHGCKNISEPYAFDPVGIDDMINNGKNISVIPNPFSGNATIYYTLNKSDFLSMSITDLMGVEVLKPLDMEYLTAGRHSIEFDSSILPPGVYFCTLRADGFVETVKMVVVK
ncbi:MAG: T9SS type A sorting domain-containing protein [bacterium]